MPRAPASATAAANRGGERSPIPACRIGTVHPTNSVNFVLSIVSSLGRGICLVRLIAVTPRDHASTRERIEALEQVLERHFRRNKGDSQCHRKMMICTEHDTAIRRPGGRA